MCPHGLVTLLEKEIMQSGTFILNDVISDFYILKYFTLQGSIDMKWNRKYISIFLGR